jgi:hypothetical protein
VDLWARRSRNRSVKQGEFSFVGRPGRHDRQFRVAIVLATSAVVAGIVLGSFELRSRLWLGVVQLRDRLSRASGATASARPASEEEWAIKRSRKVDLAVRSLVSFLDDSPLETRKLFDVAGFAPGSALHRWGRGDQVFMFSSRVFEEDTQGRSYRFKPNTRSVWLSQLTMQGGPHGLLLIPDRPDVREQAAKAGGVVVKGSEQKTNSWGLRGPEPNLDAKVRVMVLGDSFMQGMFIGDDVTPSAQLERYLAQKWKTPVSVLNTGHVGYSPEQYYHTFLEYAGRFRPQIVVISVCHNDFGEDQEVLNGKGDMYGEAAYWLNRLIERFRGVNIAFLIVPVPHDEQIERTRTDGHYPGRLFDDVKIGPKLAISLVDDFINEDLRLKRDEPDAVAGTQSSILYNAAIQDGHFSALGAALWAKLVGTRIALMFDPSTPVRQFFDALPKPPRP